MTRLRMMGARAAAVLALFAGTSCSSRHDVAAPEPGPVPPQVVETFPAAGSERVPYDVPELWVRFAEPLDSSTVTASNVFLKLYTERKSVAVRWDAATQRIVIRPMAPLALSESYTVELRPQLRTSSGMTLGAVYGWQFTVTGLRRIEHPYPADSASDATPFTPLTWDRTESGAGTIQYDLYAGLDSAAVAARTVPPLTLGVPEYIRYEGPFPWSQRVYWSVTARNLTRGERVDGPLWRFDTARRDAPVDSVTIPASSYAFYELRTGRSFCNENRLLFGRSNYAVAAWNVSAVQPGARVAAARIRMGLAIGTVVPVSSISSTAQSVRRSSCDYPGMPAPLTFLSVSTTVPGSAIYYASDALTAHIAAMHQGLASAQGFRLEGSGDATYLVPPTMVLYFYR